MKRLNIHIFFPLIAAMLLAVGCQKEKPNDASDAIKVFATVEEAGATKAAVTTGSALSGVTFLLKEDLNWPAVWAGAKSYTGDVAATTGAVTFTSATPKYNVNKYHSMFLAYYPGGAMTNDVKEWAIDGKTDILITNSAWTSGNIISPTTAGLTFNHQLSYLVVICKAEANTAIDVIRAAWGNITRVELLNTSSKLKYDLSQTSIRPVTYSTPVDLILSDNASGTFAPTPIPLNTNASATAIGLVAPMAATSTESFKLRITTAGTGKGPIVTVIPVSLNNAKTSMKAGYTHRVEVVFKVNYRSIEVTSTTIEAWKSGDNGNVEVVS